MFINTISQSTKDGEKRMRLLELEKWELTQPGIIIQIGNSILNEVNKKKLVEYLDWLIVQISQGTPAKCKVEQWSNIGSKKSRY